MFLVNIRMPQQTSLSEADRVTRMVEDGLGKSRLVKYYIANIGKGNPQIYYNVPQQAEKSDFAQIFVELDEDTKPLAKKSVIDSLRARFASFAYARVEVKDFEQGPPIDAPIAIRIFGDNLDTLRRISFQVDHIIDADKGTVYVDNDLNALKTDIKLNINREKARTLGVFTADIDRTLRLVIAGLKIGSFTNETGSGDDYDVVVSSKHDKFAMLDVFKNLFVNNALGTPIPLTQLATITFETSPAAFWHFNKNRFVEITAYTQKNVLANDVLKRIVPTLNALKMPEGYAYKLSGEAESEGDAFGGGFITVILLTVFLFTAVLILQFKTFKGILIVLSVIPLGVVGGGLDVMAVRQPDVFHRHHWVYRSRRY